MMGSQVTLGFTFSDFKQTVADYAGLLTTIHGHRHESCPYFHAYRLGLYIAKFRGDSTQITGLPGSLAGQEYPEKWLAISR